MLKLKRRCILADEAGRQFEFRVVSSLADGTLLLLPARRAEEVRLLAAASLSGEVLRALRDHVVAFDPMTGRFLTSRELEDRLEGASNPLLRLVAISA